MLSLHTRIPRAAAVPDLIVHDLMVLTWDQRERCRQRVRLASGEEVAMFLARGTVLRDGDLL
ncbi:MAG: urease accessory protein UreE, partial [Telluria sp.]